MLHILCLSHVTCCFQYQATLFSCAQSQDLIVWDLVGESGIARLRGHVDAVTSVLFWEARGWGMLRRRLGGNSETVWDKVGKVWKVI
jgi:hypothetical protein